MTSKELQSYPTAPLGDKNKEAQVNYVLGIMEGMSKEEAYRDFFPDRYSRVKDSNHRLKSAIWNMEQGEFVSKMMRTANKQSWSRYISKVHKVMDKVYDTAMDSDDERNSLMAANTYLKFAPKPPEEIDIKVEVDIKDEYKKMLLERKKYMSELANDDVIEVEVEK